MSDRTRVGVYPGSFNPPTLAHLAVAEAACHHGELDRVDLVVSEVPLGKVIGSRPALEERLAVLEDLVASRPHLGLRRSSAQLLVDLAAGADAVILGADKWAQLIDPRWYGDSISARDEAIARLPLVLVAPRPPFPLPEPSAGQVQIIPVSADYSEVSSTAVRAGRFEWMAPEARDLAERYGAWGRGSHS